MDCYAVYYQVPDPEKWLKARPGRFRSRGLYMEAIGSSRVPQKESPTPDKTKGQ